MTQIPHAFLLMLEFKESKLNAYSSMIREKYPASLNKNTIKTISVGISDKVSTKYLLGAPLGKARCPSVWRDYRELCDKGQEIWLWITELDGKYLSLSVAFDENGTVSHVENRSRKH